MRLNFPHKRPADCWICEEEPPTPSFKTENVICAASSGLLTAQATVTDVYGTMAE